MLPFKGYKLGHVFVTAYVIRRIHGGMYDLVLRSWVQGFLMPCNFANQLLSQASVLFHVEEESNTRDLIGAIVPDKIYPE